MITTDNTRKYVTSKTIYTNSYKVEDVSNLLNGNRADYGRLVHYSQWKEG